MSTYRCLYSRVTQGFCRQKVDVINSEVYICTHILFYVSVTKKLLIFAYNENHLECVKFFYAGQTMQQCKYA